MILEGALVVKIFLGVIAFLIMLFMLKFIILFFVVAVASFLLESKEYNEFLENSQFIKLLKWPLS